MDRTGGVILIVSLVMIVAGVLFAPRKNKGADNDSNTQNTAEFANTRDKLKSLALEANEALTEYIEFHDKVNSAQATLASVVNTIGATLNGKENIPFDQFYEESVSLETEWEMLADKVKSTPTPVVSDEVEFHAALVDFVGSVLDAVTALKERQKLLLEISNGADHPFSRLSKLEGDYNQAIQTYTQNGRKLQQIWSRVFQ